MCLSSDLPDYKIESQEVRSVGLVRECTKADGNVADTLQAEQKGCASSATHYAYPPDTPAI